MSISYTLRESVSGFKRAKLSTFVSILTISISLFLLGTFAVVTINASRFVEELRNRVEMEAFLQEPLTREDLDALRKEVLSVEGVQKVAFVSKEDAAKIFKQEFGEDITNVLTFNPLPPSFKISLKEGYKTSGNAKAIYSRLQKIKGVESIVYRKALLEILDERTNLIHNVTLGLGILISLSAVFLVSNTIRLAIYAKRRLLRTMELVGATAVFIRLPFLLGGIIQGLFGGLLASGVLYALIEYAVRFLSVDFSDFIRMNPVFYLMVVAAGVFLGLVGSIISVVRFVHPTEFA